MTLKTITVSDEETGQISRIPRPEFGVSLEIDNWLRATLGRCGADPAHKFGKRETGLWKIRKDGGWHFRTQADKIFFLLRWIE